MLEFDPDEHPFPHKHVTEMYNHLGYGCLHRVYQNALQIELVRRDRTADLEKRINVDYKNVPVGYYDADIVVDGAVIVEIKIAPQYDKRDEAQLLNLLKASGFKVGILINFVSYKVEYRRLIC